VNQLRSLLLTALVLLGAAVPVYAQVDGYADLGVCNKGTVPVEVVAATKNPDLLRGVGKYYWNIEGTAVPPGKCKNVYHDTDAGGAYLAFGFYDAKGQWGSGTIAQVPNLGTHSVYFREYPVLTSASKGVCARLDETEYNTPDDPQIDCAGIRLTGGIRKEVGHGAFFPLTSALYFEPEGAKCIRVNSQTNCNGGDYYLNISPSATDRELHAARGTAGGAEVPLANSSLPVTPIPSLKQFVDACNAFYGGPASSKYGMTNASSWCACLGSQYLNVMTPDEEAKYANDFFRLFHNGIAQPFGYGTSKTDPAWSRLHPAVDRCRQ